MAIVSPIVPPRTNDQKEIDKFYREMAKRFSYHENAGSPSGSITPRWIGDLCLDTTNDDWYKAYGSTNTDWKSITD